MIAGLLIPLLLLCVATVPARAGDDVQDYEVPFQGQRNDIEIGGLDMSRREWCRCLSENPSNIAREFSKALIESLFASISADIGSALATALDFFGLGTVSIGPRLNLDYGGYFELMEAGGADLSMAFPAGVSIAYPEPNSFSRQNTIRLTPSWTPRPGSTLSVEPPFYNTELGVFLRDLRFEVAFQISTPEGPCVPTPLGDVCFPPAVNINLGTFEIWNSNLDVDAPLITVCEEGFNAPDAQTLLGCGPFFGDAWRSLNGGPYTLPLGFLTITSGPGELCIGSTAIPCTIAVPEIAGCFRSATPGELAFSRHDMGRRLRRAGTKEDILEMGVDVVSFLDLVFDALGITCLATSFDFGAFSIDIGDITPTYYIDQDMTFDVESTPRITLDLLQPMAWTVIDPVANTPVNSGTGRFVTMLADHVLDVTYPDTTDPTDVAPTFALDSDLSTQARQTDSVGIELRIFEFNIPNVDSFVLVDEATPKLPICIPGSNCGSCTPLPACPVTVQQATTSVDDAFAPIVEMPFPLDPENPIIEIEKEVSAVRNNGGGARTITYTYQLTNAGDVSLHHVQVEEDLQTAFSAADAWSIDSLTSCDFEVNPNFDGAGDIHLLTDEPGVPDGGHVLQVGASGLVVLIVTVFPGPSPMMNTDPFPFTNVAVARARSKINFPYIPTGTPVMDVAEATVNLGPAQIAGLQDFVLYANEKLTLQRTLDSFGHIGANEAVHVKQGDAGTLAGDMHGRLEIHSDGQMLVDYAFTDTARFHGKGDLDVTGHLVEGTVLPNWPMLPVVMPVETRWAPDVTVGPGGTMHLDPGTYGKVEVKEGATLHLRGGTYNIHALVVKKDGRVHCDPLAGAVHVNVATQLLLHEDVQMSIPPFPASTRDVTFHIAGTSTVNFMKRSHVLGTFYAPEARIALMQDAHLEGAAYAQDIDVQEGASYRYHDESCDGPLYLLFDEDCDGVPNCLDAD
jgi:hypothetical protein